MSADIYVLGQHSAEIVVRVFPIGKPGQVKILVTNNGPVELDKEEMAFVLRNAASMLYTEAKGEDATPSQP